MSDSESDYSDSDDGGGRKGPRMKEREWDDALMRRALRMLHAHKQLYGTRLGPEKAAEKVEWPGMESSIYRASKELYAIEGNGAREAFIAAWTKPKKGIERYGAD